jgi:hypothetical protein
MQCFSHMNDGKWNTPRWLDGLGYSLSLLDVQLSTDTFPKHLLLGAFGERYQILSAGAEKPLSLNALRLFAEFHLPSRKQDWIMQLRRSRYNRLKQLIPPCLKSSTTHAPVGTVLYPLGISSLQQLTQLHQQKHRSFFCRFSDGSGISLNAGVPLQDWLTTQERCLTEEVYIAELPSQAPDKLRHAEYTEDVTCRVVLQKVQELDWPEAGWEARV